MKDIIYRQSRSGDCADYAMLSACQKLGVDVNEKDNIYKDELSLQAVADRFIDEWKIKKLTIIRGWPKIIDMWLSRGHYIVCGTWKLSFTSVATFPYLQRFDGQIWHNFCIVEDMEDKWKVKDSQGSKFADNGYWYMLKSDFPKIKRFRIEL